MAEVSTGAARPVWRSFVAYAIDTVAVVLAVFVGIVSAPRAPWAWAVACGLFALVALVLWRGSLGGSVGNVLTRVRTIDRNSGLPSFRFLAPRKTVRRGSGEDPFAIQPRPVLRTPVAPTSRLGEQGRSYLRLVVDDGTSHTVPYAALIGRDPTLPPDARHSLIAIPDLTRTIAKAHLLVQVADAGVVITDLQSAKGTWVEGASMPLVPQQPTAVDWGSTLLLGERKILLERRDREAS